VATDGTVQDPNGLALTTGATDELSPALTNASSWGLVYHHPLGDGSGIYHRGVK
jgi:Tfp pilus assembly protein PilW